jgi:transposase
MWFNIYEYLTKKQLDVRLSNSVKTRAIASAKIKTDKLDAIKLADLLRGGYIAECYVPNRRIMDLRELVRHRAALVRMRTQPSINLPVCWNNVTNVLAFQTLSLQGL